MGTIQSIQVGRCVNPTWAAARGKSAIEKLPVSGVVAVGKLGLHGDEQAADFHGGVLQAVYAYAREDLDWWSSVLGRPLRDGMFGENVDTVELDVNGASLAEQWLAGDVVLEVTAPRMACGTFGAWMREKEWGRRFSAARRPGAYLRVLREGTLTPGCPVDVVWRPRRRVTVAESVSAILGDKDVLRRINDLADDVPGWDPAAMMYHVWRRAKSAGENVSGPAPSPRGEQTDARLVR
jgi:MOSC domain-containing protein YiiM